MFAANAILRLTVKCSVNSKVNIEDSQATDPCIQVFMSVLPHCWAHLRLELRNTTKAMVASPLETFNLRSGNADLAIKPSQPELLCS